MQVLKICNQSFGAVRYQIRANKNTTGSVDDPHYNQEIKQKVAIYGAKAAWMKPNSDSNFECLFDVLELEKNDTLTSDMYDTSDIILGTNAQIGEFLKSAMKPFIITGNKATYGVKRNKEIHEASSYIEAMENEREYYIKDLDMLKNTLNKKQMRFEAEYKELFDKYMYADNAVQKAKNNLIERCTNSQNQLYTCDQDHKKNT